MISASVRVASWSPFCLLLLNACNNSSAERPTVVGDWFTCRNDSCSQFDSSGVRFEPGGALISLRTDDDLISAEAAFCVTIREQLGTYTFDGQLLEIEADGGSRQFETSLVGNSMVLVPLTNEGSRVEIRRFETRAAPNCGGFDDPDDPPIAISAGLPVGDPLKPSPPDGNGPRIDGHVGPRSDAGSADAGSALLPDAGQPEDAGSAVLPDGGTEAGAGAVDSGFSDRDGAASDAGALP